MVHEGQEYSVFCLHHVPGTWDHVRVKELIGDRDGDAKYFSIVRDPVDLFISMWDYYDFSGTLKMDLETFAMNTSMAFKRRMGRRARGQAGYNMMLFDFGLPLGSLDNESAVVAMIAQIESNFDLIMVMEQFDESLLLLRELMCWEWDDMMYLKLNSQQKTKQSKLSPDGRARLKMFLKSDYLLYDHFKKRFQDTLWKYAGNVEHDLRLLRSLNGDIKMDCVKVLCNNHLIK